MSSRLPSASLIEMNSDLGMLGANSIVILLFVMLIGIVPAGKLFRPHLADQL